MSGYGDGLRRGFRDIGEPFGNGNPGGLCFWWSRYMDRVVDVCRGGSPVVCVIIPIGQNVRREV